MVNKLKNSKLNNPDILTIIFLIATAIVVLERGVAFCNIIVTTNTSNMSWNSFEYTLSILIPLYAFIYFCSSTFAYDTTNKLKLYMIAYIAIAIIFFCMLGQLANNFCWFIFKCIGIHGTALESALLVPGFEGKLNATIRVFTFYIPLITIFPTYSFVTYIFTDDFMVKTLRKFNIDNTSEIVIGLNHGNFRYNGNPKESKVPDCDVKLCSDLIHGKDVIIHETRRMESIMVQGATGTGKTSTLLLPMCASDLELKYKYKELSKEAAIEALEKGVATLNAPYSNEQINKYFSLDMISPVSGKEEEFRDVLGDLIKCIDPYTGKTIYKNLGLTVLEPDGQYIDDFKEIANNLDIPVFSVDPMDPNSYGINPFINQSPAKVASIISTVLKGMYESEDPDPSNLFFTQVTQQALENLSILLKLMYPRLHNGDLPTLEDMLQCLYDYSIVENMCENLKKDPVLRESQSVLIKYFEKNFYSPPLDINGRPVLNSVGSNRKETEHFLYGATTQLDNLMRNKWVKSVLCSRTNNLDLDVILEKGYCVTVCTRRGELGALLSKPFGMFYILTMQDAVLRRPGDENTRIPHFMYIDEFPDFVNKETEACFTLFRKYRCGMVVAIQNLSQLSRNESMKFYKEVVTSNSKTLALFGDTNYEDSCYWSEAFGKREFLYVTGNMAEKTLPNVNNPEDAGMSHDEISFAWDFTYYYNPWNINELPFRQIIYRTRTRDGHQIFGKGITDFVDKKYYKRFEPKMYNFTKYSSDSTLISGTPSDGSFVPFPNEAPVLNTKKILEDSNAFILNNPIKDPEPEIILDFLASDHDKGDEYV